jgi:putative hydrolase of the HAD superfamily
VNSGYQDWVFDLDNTLYPASSSLFPQIDRRMRRYIAETLKLDLDEAFRLQKRYYRDFGTTLRGLMQVHGLEPDEFLAYVHDIDCTVLEPSPRLNAALARLPGRKFIFTNGSARHAANVLAQLDLAGQFEGVFDIKAAGYLPKPAIETYRRLLAEFEIEAKGAVMFEDLARNLAAAAELGMTTVWVRQEGHPDGRHDEGDLTGIDHVTDDLAGWLESRLP